MWGQARQIEIICRRGILSYNIPLFQEAVPRLLYLKVTVPEEVLRAVRPAEPSWLEVSVCKALRAGASGVVPSGPSSQRDENEAASAASSLR